MLTLNSKVLKIGNKWLIPVNGSGPTPPSTTYYVTTSGTHGSVTASPTEGTTGTEVTLSNTPDSGYEFDSYTLTGATLKNSNQFDIANSDVSVVGNFREPVDPYNPLNLPPNTIRVRTSDGNAPNTGTYESANLVTGTSDVYDIYQSGTSFYRLFYNSSNMTGNIIEVLGANTSGITDMTGMFYGSKALTSVTLFDTSSVTDMSSMFSGCKLLKSIPLFNTSKVTSLWSTFSNCYAVESGALALYQQASSQATPPSSHSGAFKNCGRDTVTGAAELAQIPSGWK